MVMGDDVVRSTRAAATLAGGTGVVRGLVVHLVVSGWWTGVLALVDQRWPLDARRGALAGLAIAVIDLEVVGRRAPAVRALPRWGQWADHVAFGALVGALVGSTVDRPGRWAGPRPDWVRVECCRPSRCRAWR
ncbi:hypothetical protein [Saccharothrix hoggarensis]|uniref:VanZ like protein n=1 Tax=Saccharothrix hoggarensis TaxID=913853 RepID=A0ABW3QTY9_9PSEU